MMVGGGGGGSALMALQALLVRALEAQLCVSTENSVAPAPSSVSERSVVDVTL